MTELMKQLQQLANDGLYDWEGKRFKTPYGWIDHEDLVLMAGNGLDFIKKDYRLRHSQMGKILLVLVDTIKVLRPVEHYKPKNNENVLLFDPTHTDEYGEPLTTVIGYYREEDGEFHRFEIYRNGMTLMSPIHWQPLPEPPQKGGE